MGVSSEIPRPVVRSVCRASTESLFGGGGTVAFQMLVGEDEGLAISFTDMSLASTAGFGSAVIKDV